MDFWMIYVLIAVVAILFEVFIPTMFCINFAIAALITAIVSIFWGTTVSLLWIFFGLSILSIIFIKPLLDNIVKKENNADFEAQYIGKIVKCIEPITTQKGAVSIYDERWDARTLVEGEEIPVDSEVRIIKNDSTTLYVEKK